MKVRLLNIVGCLALAGLAVSYGMMAYRFELPPYNLVKALSDFAGALTPKEFNATPQEYFTTDVAGLISIKQPEDLTRLRRVLIALLWGSPGLPISLPTTVDHDFKDRRYDDIPSLTRIDKLGIVMEYGLESQVYHFIPKNPNNQVVFYHQGHGNDFYTAKPQIKQLLDGGYAVVAFAMP